jgi:ferric-chelate reductase
VRRHETHRWVTADNSGITPHFFLLALGALLVICMILSYNRFMARLLASSKLAPSQERAEKLGLGGPARVLGGGDLATGWVLRRGKTEPIPEETVQDPFADDPVAFASRAAPVLFPPPHLSPLLHYLPFAPLLQYTPFSRFPIYLRSSITIARLYPAFCYVALVIVAVCWKSDLGPTLSNGAGRDFARTGNMAVAQIPIVIALGVKGNLVGLAMGVGYEKLQILHKLVGRMIFICSTVHVGYFSKYYSVIRAQD